MIEFLWISPINKFTFKVEATDFAHKSFDCEAICNAKCQMYLV